MIFPIRSMNWLNMSPICAGPPMTGAACTVGDRSMGPKQSLRMKLVAPFSGMISAAWGPWKSDLPS